MKLIRLIYLVSIVLCTTNQWANAQKNYLYDAERAYINKEYFSAIDNYKKAFAKADKKKKPEILFKIADLYRNFGDPNQAQTYYEKAIEAKYPDPIAVLYLADVLKKQEKYVDAIAKYNEYTSLVPADKRGEEGAKSCELAQKWKDKPTRFKVENLQQINTPEYDYSPSFPDRTFTSLYFSSTREGSTGGIKDMTIGNLFSDIFETKLDKNGKWSTPVPLPEPLNTKYNEAANVLSKKGTTIYLTRGLVAKNKRVTCQLYSAEKKGNGWDEPVLLPFNVDSLNFGHPALTPDDNTLVFASDMPGGQGGLDLWYAKYNKKDKSWDPPVNLGEKINTPGDETFPFVHDDGSLYFASTAHLGMGGLDIFKADKKGENKWDNPTNLQSPINSAADDFGIIFEGNAKRGYLTSNREGGKGADDIYSFVVPPFLFTMEGSVVEKDSKKTIEGATVKLVGSDGSVAELKTDKNGIYKFDTKSLNENTSYTITASGIDIKTIEAPRGYLGNPKAQFTTVGMDAGKDFKQNFELILIKQEIRMPLVLFNLNKWDLEHPSNPKDSLEYLYKILVENPNITVELAAHTDSRSPDKYNLDLSYKRAKACVDYLISKGVSGERITPKGYGESRPLEYAVNGKKVVLTEKYINSFKTVEEREALHQQNRRVVFSVLRTDYVEKNKTAEEKAKAPEIKVVDDATGTETATPSETTAPKTDDKPKE